MIPSYEEIMLPLLQFLNDGEIHSLDECTTQMCNHFHLTKSEQEELIPSGKITVIRSRTLWARFYMAHAGLIKSARRGAYFISEEGLKLLATNPTKITTAGTLMKYPSFVEFRNSSQESNSAETESPKESIDNDDNTASSRRELYESFLKKFPLESIANMPLEEYTNLNKYDSFCYWVENKTKILGSIKGGSSFKFGIYEYVNRPESKKITTDDRYAWYSLLKKNTAQEAYKVIRETIVKIALLARRAEWNAINDITLFGTAYKWKIAFLYSNLSLIPIYKEDWLNIIATKKGMKDAQSATFAEKQEFLMGVKDVEDLFEYYDKLLKLCKLEDKNGNATLKDEEQKEIPALKTFTLYTENDFLNEVYIGELYYQKLKNLLLNKKNVILQGAPGVGKTFAAKRLAYSIIGERDDDRIELVQFHQNYTYEDFIMGYKPTETGGFKIREGVFYSFCKRAEDDTDRPYFFIIDEINRGNLSKIFGELLMLIEKDYRGTKARLAYRDEEFSVPRNVFIIGMMNTADRSLAMIDYALRRRFSFFEMRPAFQSEGFKRYEEGLANEKFNQVIEAVVRLNDTIMKDDSLGSGFCIGHSYFCNQEKCDELWLSNVIEYDLLPMIREYWFDNDKKYKEESEKLMSILK